MDLNNTGIKRKPTHPGEMLREDFIPDYELSVSGLAGALGRLFGSSAEFWLNARPSRSSNRPDMACYH